MSTRDAYQGHTPGPDEFCGSCGCQSRDTANPATCLNPAFHSNPERSALCYDDWQADKALGKDIRAALAEEAPCADCGHRAHGSLCADCWNTARYAHPYRAALAEEE